MSVHELLPWYANETLGPDERAAFEGHLAACPECRAELELVVRMRSKLRESGPAALSDHPSPEELLAAVRPEQADTKLDPDSAREVRRHLALCLTCADEAEWLTGDAVATAAGESSDPSDDESASAVDAAPRRRGSVLPWLGLVAALVVIAVLVPLAFRDSTPTPGVATRAVVSSIQRTEKPRTIELSPGSSHVILMFEVDLGPRDYPARIRVEMDAHEVGRAAVEDKAGLFEGLFLEMACHRTDCPDGDYVAHLTKADSGPAVEYRFRLETTPNVP